MTDNELKRIVALVMQADLQTNGPISDNPREAYVRGIERGIEAALIIGGLQ